MSKPKIMIVDDHKDTISSFRAVLEQHGYHVDTFTDPKEALNNFSPKS